ncbi:MAG: zinc-binding dehydrogenase [Agriterribacter sp.]
MNQALVSFPPGRAVIFNGHGKPFEFVSHTLPLLKPGEILVKILYTTLCGSDIHTYCGRRQEPPHVVLGHEIAGEIMWISPEHNGTDINGTALNTGDLITWAIFQVPFGVSAPKEDMPQKSEGLFKYGHVLASGDEIFNGGLADYCIIKYNTAVIKLDKSVPLKVAATISCAHATIMGAVRVAGDIKEQRVVVFGAGLLGLSCVAMCKEAGASYVTIVDIDESRLKWGEKFGADYTFLLDGADTKPWGDADIVFDMTGHPGAMKTGLETLAIGGRAIWIGAVYPDKPVEVDAQHIVRKILQIRGLHNYNYDDFVNAAAFITKHVGHYPFELLVEKEFSLNEIEEAFQFAHSAKPVRVGIKVND